MPKITNRCTVEAEHVGRVDRVVQAMTGLSRSKVQALFDHGLVQVNAQECANVAHRVVVGDQVTLTYDPQHGYSEKKKPWTDRTFTIVAEDDELMVVNKSAKVLTVATDDGEEENTLQQRINRYLQIQSRKKEAFLVHRLDRLASGLIVFAKTPSSAKFLQDQFYNCTAQRVYQAIVLGSVFPEKGSFQSYVTQGENLDHYSTFDPELGRLSVTQYQVLQRLENATLIQASSESGQRSQVRLHFAQEGHPVLGDARSIRQTAAKQRERNQKKAQLELTHEHWGKNRMALHASALTFVHPASKKAVSYVAPLPKTMAMFVKAYGEKNA